MHTYCRLKRTREISRIKDAFLLIRSSRSPIEIGLNPFLINPERLNDVQRIFVTFSHPDTTREYVS